MLDVTEASRLDRAARAAVRPVTIRVHPAADDPLGADLVQLAHQLVAIAGASVLLRQGDPEPPTARSSLVLSADALRVCYRAAVEGPERGPFVELLEAVLARRLPALAADARRVELQVFIAASCQHCPRVVRAALGLALAEPRVRVTIIDAQREPDLARRHGIRSVPSCVIDDGLVLVGELDEADLRQVVAGLDTPGHRTALLRSLIESGRIDDALALLGQPDGLVHFVALWTQSTTGMRIGLLLLAEKALERDVSALDPCVGGLLPLLRSSDAALRGDSADLLGRIGSDTALSALRPLRQDPDPEVAEIVAEALEHNSRRNRPS